MTDWRIRFPWTAAAIGVLWPEGRARRKRWLMIAVVVILVIAAHAGLTVIQSARTLRAERRFSAHWGPLDMATHRPVAVDDDANAARVVRAAVNLLAVPSTRVGAEARLHERFASEAARDFTAADRDAIRDRVRANSLPLSILDVAAARPGSNWGLHYEWGIEIEVPPLRDIMHLANLNAGAGRLAVEDGRVDDALVALRRGRAIAGSLENEPIVIVQLVRLAVTRLDAQLTRLVLGHLDLSPEQLAILAALPTDARPRQRMQQAMISEAKAILDMFGNHAGMARSTTRHSREENLLSLGIVRSVARPYLLAEKRTWLDLISSRLEPLDLPRHARRAAPPEEPLRSWNILVRLVESDVEAVIARADLAEARAGLARTAIAIERHRAARGHAPGTVAELIPEYLEAPATDPLTGRPFAYTSDGSGWSLRSEADGTAMRGAGLGDPVLEWSRPLTPPTRAARPSRPS